MAPPNPRDRAAVSQRETRSPTAKPEHKNNDDDNGNTTRDSHTCLQVSSSSRSRVNGNLSQHFQRELPGGEHMSLKVVPAA